VASYCTTWVLFPTKVRRLPARNTD
jgi:hypothetical protein